MSRAHRFKQNDFKLSPHIEWDTFVDIMLQYRYLSLIIIEDCGLKWSISGYKVKCFTPNFEFLLTNNNLDNK